MAASLAKVIAHVRPFRRTRTSRIDRALSIRVPPEEYGLDQLLQSGKLRNGFAKVLQCQAQNESPLGTERHPQATIESTTAPRNPRQPPICEILNLDAHAAFNLPDRLELERARTGTAEWH